jgi:hypothetical protein
MRPAAVRIQLSLLPTDAGGRSEPLSPDHQYRPHFLGDSGEFLGTGIILRDLIVPGGSGSAIALLPFEVDYSLLCVGGEYDVMEGPRSVGRAIVNEIWDYALELRLDTHSLGVCLLVLEDPGMGLWTGPFLPRPGYNRVRPIFRRFGDASDGRIDLASDARRKYYEERDSLGLRAFVWPAGEPASVAWIHICDFGDLSDLTVDIQGWQPDEVSP